MLWLPSSNGNDLRRKKPYGELGVEFVATIFTQERANSKTKPEPHSQNRGE